MQLSFMGGILIGLATWLMLAGLGRVTGISGILASALMSADQRGWRLAFIVGLIIGGAWATQILNIQIASSEVTPILCISGLLVGFGTVLGSGCTSGHGVCGLARFSKRSLVSVMIFMAVGMLTVTIMGVLK